MDKVDQTQKSSNSSSGGGGGSTGCGLGLSLGLGGVARSSKKRKQKKAPQRGLGVAQLEKIRLEEQQKKDAAAVAGAAILSPPPSVSPSKSSFLSLPIPNYHHYCPPSSSIPFLSPSLADLSLPNLIINPPVQSVDARSSCSFPLTSPLNTGGFEVGWSEMSVPGHGGVPQLWNSYENNHERENSGLDPGLAFRSSLNFPFESDNPVWPPPTLMPRAQQPSHLMVNVSSGTTSSALNFRMEPPSNQSYYGNYRPLFPEEEKMVGMKRPYPFSLENPPGLSFNCTLPTLVAPIRSEESASYVHGGTFNLEGSSTALRGPSCSTSNRQLNSKESIKEHEVLHGDFLSLSSPGTTSTYPSSKLKNHSTSPVSLNPRFPDPESLPYQGTAELCELNQQEPFYCFLPPAKVQVGQEATTMNDSHGEVAESTDLSLKL